MKRIINFSLIVLGVVFIGAVAYAVPPSPDVSVGQNVGADSTQTDQLTQMLPAAGAAVKTRVKDTKSVSLNEIMGAVAQESAIDQQTAPTVQSSGRKQDNSMVPADAVLAPGAQLP